MTSLRPRAVLLSTLLEAAIVWMVVGSGCNRGLVAPEASGTPDPTGTTSSDPDAAQADSDQDPSGARPTGDPPGRRSGSDPGGDPGGDGSEVDAQDPGSTHTSTPTEPSTSSPDTEPSTSSPDTDPASSASDSEDPDPEPTSDPPGTDSGSPPELDPLCRLAPDPGPCEAAIRRWYFDPEAGVCQVFIYGGCQGNPNNFSSELACLKACGALKDPCQRLECQAHQTCEIDPTTQDPYCADSCQKFVCLEPTYCVLDPVICVRAPCPPVARCIAGPKQCLLPPDPGPCRAAFRRWYFNSRTGRCEEFLYGGCQGNENNFTSQETCETTCGA